MIPKNDDNLIELEEELLPSKNYRMIIEQNIINGYRDNIDAMKQVIYKILNTERYQYLIYSWDYGIELQDLFGEPVSYVCPELERRIKEALEQDDRINVVDSFDFDISERRTVKVKFMAHTIFGDLDAEKVVKY